MVDRRFIVVEGALGAGKTTLAKILAERLSCKLVLDTPNPFIGMFFEDMDKFAFQLQVFSLLGRYHQQKDILQVDLFSQGMIADYLFASEHIFAELHLNQEEFVLYDKLLRTMNVQAPIPDLVIYLQSKPHLLYEKLQSDGPPYCKDIPLDYLEDMTSAYNDYFFRYHLSPLLVVNTEHVDFFSGNRHIEDLIEEINKVKSGVHHFVPADVDRIFSRRK
jgi:deoxyadenosine/deoxycytidine kinase